MLPTPSEKSSPAGPYRPTVILHGGAGGISRAGLPPALYARYHASLLKYLTETRDLLDAGASALDAACYAATRFEDDPLFNCGRGAVFTEQGTIEMEASVMVCSLDPAGPALGSIKRGAAVSLIRNTRHPILLAKEVLVAADDDGGLGGTSSMHSHLSGPDVEAWGWKEKALEKKPDRWFWTRKRWEEHRRGLQLPSTYTYDDLLASVDPLSTTKDPDEETGLHDLPSQGTVGAVCLDSWGNLAVATSTGGLTNKKAGRIGDTPTIGSGFWAESWEEDLSKETFQPTRQLRYLGVNHSPIPLVEHALNEASNILGSCLNVFEPQPRRQRLEASPSYTALPNRPYQSPQPIRHDTKSISGKRRRAVAMSGTGNGDSFLRVNAARTAAALCRFSKSTSLADAVTAVAGPDGELQLSAGDRWGCTGEGQGGIIGIELVDDDVHWVPHGNETQAAKKVGHAVFDFNCGGLFRAYYEIERDVGEEKPKVMVFKDEY
ncbi:L-asparaginase [Exophiala viscosa]|uniref:L-asparaginase n=1 Tax=Exophiala viscosa TaxID=2486360 RepID=A0AAN6IB03_9EURO|nr:L-asparaginase [Exophiala viscosa]